MKKTWKFVLLGTAVAAAMTVSAAAANFTGCADSLNQMGLFSGTDKGYELDRAPSRAESAVMLVRLLGGEKEAVAEKYATPFTDVPAWAEPYVGWLYEKGLTAGTSATTFGTTDPCTAQMYSTFLLRSLGYADSGAAADFQFADAIAFAREKGVVDFMNCDESNFLRDDVVAMSYTALSVKPKDGKNDTLLDQLISTGAVDSDKASSVKNTFAAYQDFTKLNESTNAQSDMAMTVKGDMEIKMNGLSLATADMDMNIKAKMDMDKLDNSKMALTGKISMNINPAFVGEGESPNMTQDTEGYYTNGAFYSKSGDQKTKMAMSLDEIMQQFGMTSKSSVPISMFSKLEKNSDGSFNISYAVKSFNDMISEMMAAVGAAGEVSAAINSFDFVVVPKNGKISSMKANLDMSCAAEGQTIDMVMHLDYTVTASGNVTVTLPSDLNTYQSVN